jgi:hypothetical protein
MVATNNELSTFVNVLSGGLNVLYIEGSLRVETKFLRRALDSSPDIRVDYVRLDAEDPQSRPADFADRFRAGKYDVYILGDVDSTAFLGDELTRLAGCVSRGAGLIMLGGFQMFGPGGYDQTPLAKVLPVGMDRFERQRPNEPLRTDLLWPGPLRMRPTALGQHHFALMLAGSRAESEALWSKLPPLEAADKFHELAPGAVVLADAGPERPLLVAQNFGYEAAFKRFWRQIVLWLAKRDQAQEGRVWVRLPERRFAPAQRVEFAIGATAPNGEPVADAAFKAELVSPDGTRRPLPLARQEDQVQGSVNDTLPAGDYAIEVAAEEKDKPLGSARARFLVIRQDLELDNPSADADTLKSLAAMTGGRSLAPEQLPELIRELTENTQQLDVQQETKKTFWDTWAFFLTVVALLGLQWYLRKRWGLV